MAAPRALDWEAIRLPGELEFLDGMTLRELTTFAPDIAALDVDANTLQAHPLLRYYEEGWSTWFP